MIKHRRAGKLERRGQQLVGLKRKFVMKSTKLVMGETSAFSCPTCGQTVFDMSAAKFTACSHLRYAGYSEAPGSPAYVADCLASVELSSCDERENLRTITAALGGRAEVFELDDESGYITLHLAFEATGRRILNEGEK